MSTRHGLSGPLLDHAFPFHVVLDRDLRVIQAGPSMQRLIGQDIVGSPITTSFEIVTPKLVSTFDDLARATGTLFVLKSRTNSDLLMRGQMLHDEQQEVILFVGSPWVTNTSSFAALGLTLSDFAASDPVVDYVLLLQSRETSLSEAQSMAEQLRHQAYHDPLTGLPNRSLIVEHLSGLLDQNRSNGQRVAVLMLDLDDFKGVNDGYGHVAGDEALKIVAERLRSVLRKDDVVGRFGGDEFTIVLAAPAGTEEEIRDAASRLAERVSAAMDAPISLRSNEMNVQLSASVGIAIAERDDSAEVVIRNADLAMYSAKHREKGRAEHYTPTMHVETVHRLELVGQLRTALDLDEFRLLYQPILQLSGDKFAGAEALLRWQHPTRGLLTPDQFLDVAEQSGLMVPIGAWVLREACRELRQWQHAHPGPHPLTVAVNLSARQLTTDLVGIVRAAIDSNQLDPSTVTLEITEGLIDTEHAEAQASLAALKDLGVGLAIDDFGTGHSSLGRLRDFEFNELKIDRRFVGDIDHGDTTLVATQIAMGNALGLTVVAEGVETATELAYLRTVGCHKIQGFLVARPLPPADIRALLADPATWTGAIQVATTRTSDVDTTA